MDSVDSFSDFSAPVLLQKILQSMENPLAPRRAALNYAVLSLVVRIIAAQSGVFTLWFGRRAYERSRGEMITMLYEKTLSRKVVSLSSKPVIEVDGEGMANGNGNGHGHFKHEELSRIGKVRNCLMMPFRWLGGKSKAKKEKKKDTASMGKIMNLMR